MSRHRTNFKKHTLASESLEHRFLLDSTVVFNEIMYHPGETDTEWIELHNQMSVDVDISNWSIDGGARYSFPDGTVLKSGDYLVVAADPVALSQKNENEIKNLHGPFDGRLSNGGERLELRNHIDRLMNVIDFVDSGKWPWGPDGSGVSLAKTDPQRGTDDPTSWTSSSQLGGTPGTLNFGSTRVATLEFDAEWQFDQTGNDLGTAWRETDFDDSAWQTGRGLFFDENSALPAEKMTEIQTGPVTFYFRTSFEFNRPTEGTTVQLNHVIDDGAVFFINGVEVDRFNMPEGEINYLTTSDGSVNNASFVATQKIDATILNQGMNVLAVEVHQQSATSNDVVFGTQLFIDVPATAETGNIDGLRFDEIAAAGQGAFGIELLNTTDSTLLLSGTAIRSSAGSEFQFGIVEIAAGSRLYIGENELGFSSAPKDKLFLFGGDGELLVDTAIVENRALGRATDRDDAWQGVSQLTPGAPNTFEFENNVVINEIHFQNRPTYATAPEFGIAPVMPLDTEWKFDQSGTDLGTAWKEIGFDDNRWSVGKGLFFNETSDLPGPKSTEIVTGILTHYFRTTFELTEDPADIDLVMSHVVDDGAVFYLNGVEFSRYNVPSGDVNFETEASPTVRNGNLVGPESIPSELLIQGVNTLAVEVHQSSQTSNDVAFGLQLAKRSVVSAGTDYVKSDLEWVEIYNRSENSIDISGWHLNDAVSFEFPANTVLQPKQFLVIPGSVAAFNSIYPDVEVLGEYSGVLSNDNESIELLDDNLNIADQVHYYDGGHWPAYADAGGSSLELQDPFADNSKPEAWQASDESNRSEWISYSYTSTVRPVVHDPPINFHEFVMGLLDTGEVLIDNISVIEAPAGDAKELIQNGDFESDTVGEGARKWRLIGTHNQSHVIADPNNPDNKVLHLKAESRINYLSNHAETTLADGAQVIDGQTYQISFDAKWIAGSPQLHTELYYKDAARTTILQQPTKSGTPGAENSTRVDNLGPTFSGLAHNPIVPTSSDNVEIRVNVDDPNQLRSVTLFYADEGVAPFNSVPMTADELGTYVGIIPEHSNRSVIQFYVEATDQLGATSMYPTKGPESRALYKVDNGFSPNSQLHDFQMLMIDADVDHLHDPIYMMDNNRLGLTVISNGSEIFYDIGARLRGSMFTRQGRDNTGYNVKFHNDQPFRGVHESIAFDQNGEREILVKFFAAVSGNPGGTYDDILNVETPSGAGGGPTLAYLARHGEIHLEEQFENGADGTLFKFEGIRVLTSTSQANNPESLKLYQPIGWVPAFDIQDLGDDKETYRWPFLINRNRDIDDYSPIINLAKTFSLTGDELDAAVDELLDMDVWAHTFAIMSLFGIGDAYSQGNPHNLNIYQRPSDGKLLAFPWDWDFVFSQTATAPLHGGKNIGKVFDLPQYDHLLLGYVHHLIQTKFNTEYMSDWLGHYGGLLQDNMSALTTNIDNRIRHVESLYPTRVPFLVGTEELQLDELTLTNEASDAAALVPSVENGGDQLGLNWTQLDFEITDDWNQGKAAVGFETSPDTFAPLIDLEVPDIANNSSVFIRIPFNLAEVPTEQDIFELRMKYDDGFVAYLNGQRIADANAPDELTWDARASASHRNTAAVEFESFDLIDFKDLLQPGANVLAIHGMNRTATGGDVLIVPQLVSAKIQRDEVPVVTTDQPTTTLSGIGWINVKEIKVRGEDQPLKVRWLGDSRWQAEVPVNPGRNELVLDAYDFEGKLIGSEPAVVEGTGTRPQLDSIRISEIMYHPADPNQAEIGSGFSDADEFEFIELINITETPVSLEGVSFVEGIDFTIESVELAPGERIVLAKNVDAFQVRYGETIRVIGPYNGTLSNAGERVVMTDGPGSVIIDFSYADAGLWPVRADGVGASLELIDSTVPTTEFGKHYRWSASVDFGGTPGRSPSDQTGVAISEVLSHTETPIELSDSIELRNLTDAAIDIGGWFISDSSNDLQKFEIPIGTQIPANGFVVFDEQDFNPTPLNPAANHFALSGSNGDEVWLTIPDSDGNIAQFADDVQFIGSNNGEAFTRVSFDSNVMLPELTATLGSENSAARVGPVVISEINYHPSLPSDAALAIWPELDENDLEFLQITNTSNADIDLMDWRIRGGVDFEFVGSQILNAGSSLTLIGFDPSSATNAASLSAFEAHYEIASDTKIVGGLSGSLNNSEELIRLERATTIANEIVYVLEDLVIYDDLSPWPIAADGAGQSLQRVNLSGVGVASSNWFGANPTPATEQLGNIGDFDASGIVDPVDVDLLCEAFDSQEARFDITGDGRVNLQDLRFLISDVLGTSEGDTNLDGVFDSNDITALLLSGNYEDGIAHNSGWMTGDRNCDREFTSADIVLVYEDIDRFEQPAANRSVAAAVNANVTDEAQRRGLKPKGSIEVAISDRTPREREL